MGCTSAKCAGCTDGVCGTAAPDPSLCLCPALALAPSTPRALACVPGWALGVVQVSAPCTVPGRTVRGGGVATSCAWQAEPWQAL